MKRMRVFEANNFFQQAWTSCEKTAHKVKAKAKAKPDGSGVGEEVYIHAKIQRIEWSFSFQTAAKYHFNCSIV